MAGRAPYRSKLDVYGPVKPVLDRKQTQEGTQPDVFNLPWARFRNPERKTTIFSNNMEKYKEWSQPTSVKVEKNKLSTREKYLDDICSKKQKTYGEIQKNPSKDVYRPYPPGQHRTFGILNMVTKNPISSDCNSVSSRLSITQSHASSKTLVDYSKANLANQEPESDKRKANALERARKLRQEKDKNGEHAVMMEKGKALNKAKKLKQKQDDMNTRKEDDKNRNKNKSASEVKKITMIPNCQTTDDNAVLDNNSVIKDYNTQILDLFAIYLDDIRKEVRRLERMYEIMLEKKNGFDMCLDDDKQRIKHDSTMLLLDVFAENEHMQELEEARECTIDQKSSTMLKTLQIEKLEIQKYRMKTMQTMRMKKKKLKMFKQTTDDMYDMDLNKLRTSINELHEEAKAIKQQRDKFIRYCIDTDEEWKKTLDEDEIQIEKIIEDPQTIKRREALLKRTAEDVRQEELERAREKEEQYQEQLRKTEEIFKKTNQDFYTHMEIRREIGEKKSRYEIANKNRSNDPQPMGKWYSKCIRKDQKKWNKLHKQYDKKARANNKKQIKKAKRTQRIQALKKCLLPLCIQKPTCPIRKPTCHIKMPTCPIRKPKCRSDCALCRLYARIKKTAFQQGKCCKSKLLSIRRAGASACAEIKKALLDVKERGIIRPALWMKHTFDPVIRNVSAAVGAVKKAAKPCIRKISKPIRRGASHAGHAIYKKLNSYWKFDPPGKKKSNPCFRSKHSFLIRGVKGKNTLAKFFNGVMLSLSFRNAKLIDFSPKEPKMSHLECWTDVPILIGYGKEREHIQKHKDSVFECNMVSKLVLKQGESKHSLRKRRQRRRSNHSKHKKRRPRGSKHSKGKKRKDKKKSSRGVRLYMPYEYQLLRLKREKLQTYLKSLETLRMTQILENVLNNYIERQSESIISSWTRPSSQTSLDHSDNEGNKRMHVVDDDNIESNPSSDEQRQYSSISLSSSNDSLKLFKLTKKGNKLIPDSARCVQNIKHKTSPDKQKSGKHRHRKHQTSKARLGRRSSSKHNNDHRASKNSKGSKTHKYNAKSVSSTSKRRKHKSTDIQRQSTKKTKKTNVFARFGLNKEFRKSKQEMKGKNKGVKRTSSISLHKPNINYKSGKDEGKCSKSGSNKMNVTESRNDDLKRHKRKKKERQSIARKKANPSSLTKPGKTKPAGVFAKVLRKLKKHHETKIHKSIHPNSGSEEKSHKTKNDASKEIIYKHIGSNRPASRPPSQNKKGKVRKKVRSSKVSKHFIQSKRLKASKRLSSGTSRGSLGQHKGNDNQIKSKRAMVGSSSKGKSNTFKSIIRSLLPAKHRNTSRKGRRLKSNKESHSPGRLPKKQHMRNSKGQSDGPFNRKGKQGRETAPRHSVDESRPRSVTKINHGVMASFPRLLSGKGNKSARKDKRLKAQGRKPKDNTSSRKNANRVSSKSRKTKSKGFRSLKDGKDLKVEKRQKQVDDQPHALRINEKESKEHKAIVPGSIHRKGTRNETEGIEESISSQSSKEKSGKRKLIRKFRFSRKGKRSEEKEQDNKEETTQNEKRKGSKSKRLLGRFRLSKKRKHSIKKEQNSSEGISAEVKSEKEKHKDRKLKRFFGRLRVPKRHKRTTKENQHNIGEISFGPKHPKEKGQGSQTKHYFKRLRMTKRNKTTKKIEEHSPELEVPVSPPSKDKDKGSKTKQFFRMRRLSKRRHDSEQNGGHETAETSAEATSRRENKKDHNVKGLFGRLRLSRHRKGSGQDYERENKTVSSKSGSDITESVEHKQKTISGRFQITKDRTVSSKNSDESNTGEAIKGTQAYRDKSVSRRTSSFLDRFRSRKIQRSPAASTETGSLDGETGKKNKEPSKRNGKRTSMQKKVANVFKIFKQKTVVEDNVEQDDDHDYDDHVHKTSSEHDNSNQL